MTVPPMLSVIIPVYNTIPLLNALYAALQSALEPAGRYELIFVDDGSGDGSLDCLRRIAERDGAVIVAAMGRNTGQQEATLRGLSLASGDYCATMDDDGQHPPSLLPSMLARLQADGLDIVYAVPEGRRESRIRSLGSVMRDRLFSVLFPHCGNTRVSSYRVMTRALVRRVLARRGDFNYFSAMVFQEPARAAAMPYPYQARPAGRSGYTAASLCSLYWKIFLHYGPFAATGTARRETPDMMEGRRLG